MTDKEKKTKVGCFETIKNLGIIFVVFGGLFMLCSRACDSETKDSLPSKNMAYIVAKNQLKNQLKSPKSAEFPSAVERASHIEMDTFDSTYSILSYVDAQNSFGASIRTPWAAKLKYLGDGEYQIIELSLIE